MKYVISWRERPAASARDYEAAHERVLEIFNKDWKMPSSFSIRQFVVRVGDYGGYMIIETDKPTDIHYVTSIFAVFEFKVEPVVDVMDAVAVEHKAIEYRKKNAS
jgi:CTP:molybdopterin cytidylyltransferase MocA